MLGRRTFKIKDVNITDMTIAIEATDTLGKGRAQVEGCTLNSNLIGINATVPVRLRNTVITGNAMSGIVAAGASGADSGAPCSPQKVTLYRATVSGNGGDPACGITRNCADVITCGTPPRLVEGVFCDTTCQGGTGIPCTSWGICDNRLVHRRRDSVMQIVVHRRPSQGTPTKEYRRIFRGGVTPRGASRDGKMLDAISTAVH